MIEIKNINVFGFEAAIRGMRNPYESHEKSDSKKCALWCESCWLNDNCPYDNDQGLVCDIAIGAEDMTLCKRLIKAGSEHRKFLRMIHVQCDVLAPRYWWAEMDKYKYVEANSSSTMHLITKRELTMDDFEPVHNGVRHILEDSVLPTLNTWIEEYKDTTDNERKDNILRSIKQLLPESYNQLRTIDTNYETLLNIYMQRKNHRLLEWHSFCGWIESLPYMSEFIGALEK